jgi:hypothetical protein
MGNWGELLVSWCIYRANVFVSGVIGNFRLRGNKWAIKIWVSGRAIRVYRCSSVANDSPRIIGLRATQRN